jgi:hypothetical protein
MVSSQDFAPLAPLIKPATIADWYNLSPLLNVANWVLGANGVAVVTAASSICGVNYSVGPNALFTARMRFTSGTVDLRIANRFLTNTSPNATYYWAGVTGANFRIGKTVDGTFTTLASVAYALAINVWADFTLRIVGDSLEATIDDGTTQASLSATDSDIQEAGTHFIRSGPTNTCNIECDSLSVAEAA